MERTFYLTLGVILLAACTGTPITATVPDPTGTPPPPTVAVSSPQGATVPPNLTATPTMSPSPIPTEAWIKQGPGDVTVPILLYHHIGVSPIDSQYYMPPDKFEEQIKLLHDWKYTSITTEMLIEAITKGAKLPPRPILITFDDGHLDNYTAAFPILQKYGFTGVLYLVGNYMGTEKYMNADQVLEMVDAGWEVGSHSTNHFDLTKLEAGKQREEIVGSRQFLEKLLRIPITTFAYPFGARDAPSMDYVRFAKYAGAMGASGYASAQGKWNLYYLQRVAIKGNEEATAFIRFLPWQGDPIYLSVNSPIP